MLSAGSGIDIDGIFGQFEFAGRGAVVAAVSGGSDSLALLLLLKAFLDRSASAARLVAVTIDHGLRPEAAGEAQAVARLCAGEAIEHRTLRWTDAKPASGLPAAAREARYRLLAGAAARQGTDLVLTGHTLDDQIETIDMRRARGDGRGLAGMAPATLYEAGCWIVRPLLGTRRAALRDFLGERSVVWVEDPSNEDAAYERPRVRAAAAMTPAAGVAAAARARLELGAGAAGLIRAQARLFAPGLVGLGRGLLAAERNAAVYALRILLAAAGGTEQLPDLARATALFERLCRGDKFRASLSRAVIDARRSAVFLRRENRGLPAAAAPQAGAVWDGRYRIGGLDDGVTLAALGLGGAAARLARDGGAVAETPASLARAALAVEPALWRGGVCAGPAGEAGAARRIIAPWARFLPSFDLDPARATAELLGADIPPEPPFAGHKERKG